MSMHCTWEKKRELLRTQTRPSMGFPKASALLMHERSGYTKAGVTICTIMY